MAAAAASADVLAGREVSQTTSPASATVAATKPRPAPVPSSKWPGTSAPWMPALIAQARMTTSLLSSASVT